MSKNNTYVVVVGLKSDVKKYIFISTELPVGLNEETHEFTYIKNNEVKVIDNVCRYELISEYPGEEFETVVIRYKLAQKVRYLRILKDYLEEIENYLKKKEDDYEDDYDHDYRYSTFKEIKEMLEDDLYEWEHKTIKEVKEGR